MEHWRTSFPEETVGTAQLGEAPRACFRPVAVEQLASLAEAVGTEDVAVVAQLVIDEQDKHQTALVDGYKITLGIVGFAWVLRSNLAGCKILREMNGIRSVAQTCAARRNLESVQRRWGSLSRHQGYFAQGHKRSGAEVELPVV